MNSGARQTQPCWVSGLIRNKGSHSGSVMGVVRSVHALRLGTVEIGSQVCVLLIQSAHVHVRSESLVRVELKVSETWSIHQFHIEGG